MDGSVGVWPGGGVSEWIDSGWVCVYGCVYDNVVLHFFFIPIYVLFINFVWYYLRTEWQTTGYQISGTEYTHYWRMWFHRKDVT